MAQGDRQKYLSRRDQLVEQVIRQTVTIADGAEGEMSITIPDDCNVFLKGIGYDYFGTADHKLQDTHRTIHHGSNQIGSVALPQQWAIPFYLRGKLKLYITNSTGASQDYSAVFIIHTDKILDIVSTGTSVAFPVASASGSFTDVRMYGQDTGGTDHVVITDANGNLIVQLEAAPTIEIGDVGLMANIAGTDTKVDAVSIGGAISLRVDLAGEGGAALSATNPLFTELTDGTTAISASNPLTCNLTDGTTVAAVTAGLTALKVDLVGEGGSAIDATNPVFVELTDGSAAISALNPLPVTATAISSPSTLLSGTVSSTGDACVPIGASTSCRKVTVQAANANTTVMYVGNAASQDIELYPGDSLDIEIDDINKVNVRRVPGGANVTANYIGA